MRKKIKIITICSSASFYKDVLKIKEKLVKKGFKVLVPITAYKMKRNKNFNVCDYKHWHKDPKFYPLKTKLIKNHFRKIEKSEAILVVNLEKNGQKGYIGGNVLIEIAIAFYLKKKIFILNRINENNPFKEEILAMKPVFLEEKIENLSF
ncbi:MAG: hypothetical protein N2482_01015 [Patescibacteria group bacterium]|nr:hypothetical protein [Patescibacteria group bacterium]